MYQVAIIGAGQLGSRHLQGLKTASSPLSITVVDSSEESLRIAKERYDIIPVIGEKSIQYVSSVEDLPKQQDLVIVATGSKPRASIIKCLLDHSTVKYLILEKVLFTRLSEYDEIGSLLNQRGVHTWVNCPRRILGSYNIIKNELDYHFPITMEYKGQEWGLCCNSMHFIDVFMYLTREKKFSITTDGIEPIVFDSKRPGYIEMRGSLLIKTEHGNQLLLSSNSNCDSPSRVEIKNGNNYFAVDEVDGVLIKGGKEISIDTPFQSQTSGILVDSILRTGYCSLTPYEESANYHRVFITEVLNKYNEIINGEEDSLPIT